jgi:hypothetical protein
MELVDLVLADYATVQPGGKYSLVGAGFTEIGARKFPCAHPVLYVFMRVNITEQDIGRNNIHIRCHKDDVDIHKQDIHFEVPSNHVGNRIIPLPVQVMNLKFDQPGNFKVSVQINGESKAWSPLRVHEIKQQQPPK